MVKPVESYCMQSVYLWRWWGSHGLNWHGHHRALIWILLSLSLLLLSLLSLLYVANFGASHWWFLTINSLRPSDAIWWRRSGLTLAQVMACCLMAPSHYLNQCWLIISEVQWHPSENNFTRNNSAINHYGWLKKHLYEILLKSPNPGLWVNLHFILVGVSGYWSLFFPLLVSWHIEAWIKWPLICRQHFQMDFL